MALQRVMCGTAIVMLLAACTSPTDQGGDSANSTVPAVVTSSVPSPASTPETPESTSATAPVQPDGPDSLATVEVVSSKVAYVFTPLTSSRHGVPALLVTTDGARTFRRAAPPTGVGLASPLLRLHFASATVGLAVLGGTGTHTTLLATSDGARTWHTVTLLDARPVVQVAGHGARLYVETSACGSSGPCSNMRVYTATSVAGPWHRAFSGAPTTGSWGTALAAWGDSVWLSLGIGGPTPRTFRSTDGGATYLSAPAAPCLGVTVVATSAHVVWISCAGGMLMGFFRTEDGRPEVNLPMSGAGTGNTFLDALTDDTAVFGTAVGEQAGLYLSTDRGTHFTRLSAIPEAFTNSGHGLDDMAFLTSLVGLAITDGSALHLTTNSGRTWQLIGQPAGS
ncbi:MAG: beta propeller repeat protein [Dermatophilaceae bacterium]